MLFIWIWYFEKISLLRRQVTRKFDTRCRWGILPMTVYWGKWHLEAPKKSPHSAVVYYLVREQQNCVPPLLFKINAIGSYSVTIPLKLRLVIAIVVKSRSDDWDSNYDSLNLQMFQRSFQTYINIFIIGKCSLEGIINNKWSRYNSYVLYIFPP